MQNANFSLQTYLRTEVRVPDKLFFRHVRTSSEGHDFEYEGVSILEVDADKITRFHAYFNPTKLGKQIVD